MINNDQELQVTLERMRQFQLQIARLRRAEPILRIIAFPPPAISRSWIG